MLKTKGTAIVGRIRNALHLGVLKRPKTMKKVFALLAVILATGPVLNAQDNDPSFRFGLKLSPNLATVRSETRGLKSSGNVLGFSFGLMAEFPIGNSGNYRFATGLNLNNIGGAWKRDFSYQESLSVPPVLKSRELETTAKLQYIELPLTIKLMTNEIGYMRYFGIVGLSAAVNIRAKADEDTPVYHDPPGDAYVKEFVKEENLDIGNDINLFKAALVGGLGAEYNLSGNTSLLLGFTYNGGFINILSFDMPNDGGKAKAMLNYFELSLGVFF